MHIVSMSNISKYFPVNRTQALSKMNLRVKNGEIHAIAGENGAGKSTLMKILHGIDKCDSGDIEIRGKTGMVSQHFKLIDDFTILDNIIIGSEPTRFGLFINREKATSDLNRILEKYGFKIDLNTKVKTLSIGQKQLVEIIKVIYNDAQILIFDEPTAALSENEADKLRDTIISLKKNGKTIIIITHKIVDIASISDRFTIIRKGKFIETVKTKDVDLKGISKHMSGEEITKTVIDTQNSVGDKIFTYNDDFYNIDLHEGEILGITGYGGCGLHHLEEKLEKLSLENPEIGYSPSNRLGKGVEINSPLSETLIAKKREQLSRWGFIPRKKVETFSNGLIEKFAILGSSEDQTGTLSGGNMQKAVLARVLDSKPKVLVLASPTWGVDIESTNSIYSKIKDFKSSGHGIILLSFDMEEILKLSNRVLVMYKGRVIKSLMNDGSLTNRVLGRYSSGLKDE